MPRRPDKEKRPIHKTSLNIPYSNWLELKLHSIDKGLYLSELVSHIFDEWLNQNRPQ